jgi:predicted Zn-dependent protease
MQFVKENPEFEHVLLDLQPADSLDRSNRSNMEWAQYYQQQNNVLKAIEYLEKALSEFPDNLEAISSLATLYLDNEQYLNAANFTTSKLELYPTQLELYVVYGKSMMAQNKGAEALVILEMGLDFIFEDSDIVFQYYALMADLYRSINNIEKSKAFTNKIKALQRE